MIFRFSAAVIFLNLLPVSVNAQSLPCEQILNYLDGSGKSTLRYDPYAASNDGWWLSVHSIEIKDPKGKVKKSLKEQNSIQGEIDPGDGILAIIDTAEMKLNGRSIIKPKAVKFKGRWIFDKPIQFEGNASKSRCSPEESEQHDSGLRLSRGISLTEPEEMNGKYVYIAYDNKNNVLAEYKFSVSRTKSKSDTDAEWLSSAYQSYLILDKCIEMAAINQPRSEIRAMMTSIDKDAKSRNLDTERLWKAANEEAKPALDQWSSYVAMRSAFNYEQRTLIREQCGILAGGITSKFREVQARNGAEKKKDF